jgi:Fusaric acid resistance protein-like
MALPSYLARTRQGLTRLAPSIRAAAAVSASLVGGQLAGRTAVGLVMAVGARRVVIADPGGEPASRAANMSIALLTGSLAGFAGTLVGHSLALSTLGMFALGWVAGVARSRSDAAGRLAASPAILFALAQILPGTVQLAGERALAVGVGGALGQLLVLGTYPRGWLELAVRRSRAGVRFLWRSMFSAEASGRFGLVLAATVSACLFVVRALDLPRGHWVVVSVLVVLRPEAAVTRRRGLERVAGTLLGCLLAVALVFLVRSPLVADLLIFFLMVGFFRLQPTAYGWSLAFFTPAVVLGISLLEPGNWHWAANRAVDVAAGTLVALGAALLGGRLTQPPTSVE